MQIDHGWSASQVRAAEQPLLAAGVPLMARAAAGLAAVVERVAAAGGRRTGRMLVLVGSGSNGGDALFAAALLLRCGWAVEVVPLGRRIHEDGLRAARTASARVLPPDPPTGAVAARAIRADVVLDGLLGTGAEPPLRAPARQVVAVLADALRNGPPVVAVDLPSGVGADDGAAHLPILRATATVTFGAMKAGLLLPPARAWTGRVHLVDIGLGPHLAGDPLVRVPDRTRPDNSGTFSPRR